MSILAFISLVIEVSLVIVDNLPLTDESTITRVNCITQPYIHDEDGHIPFASRTEAACNCLYLVIYTQFFCFSVHLFS